MPGITEHTPDFQFFFSHYLIKQWFIACNFSSVRKSAFFLIHVTCLCRFQGKRESWRCMHFDSKSTSLCTRSISRTVEVLLLIVLGFPFLSLLKNVNASSTLYEGAYKFNSFRDLEHIMLFAFIYLDILIIWFFLSKTDRSTDSTFLTRTAYNRMITTISSIIPLFFCTTGVKFHFSSTRNENYAWRVFFPPVTLMGNASSRLHLTTNEHKSNTGSKLMQIQYTL